MPAELITLLRALVATQEEIVGALAELSTDVQAIELRVQALEAATGTRGERRPTPSQTRRMVAEAQELHSRSARLRSDSV